MKHLIKVELRIMRLVVLFLLFLVGFVGFAFSQDTRTQDFPLEEVSWTTEQTLSIIYDDEEEKPDSLAVITVQNPYYLQQTSAIVQENAWHSPTLRLRLEFIREKVSED